MLYALHTGFVKERVAPLQAPTVPAVSPPPVLLSRRSLSRHPRPGCSSARHSFSWPVQKNKEAIDGQCLGAAEERITKKERTKRRKCGRLAKSGTRRTTTHRSEEIEQGRWWHTVSLSELEVLLGTCYTKWRMATGQCGIPWLTAASPEINSSGL